MQPQAEKEVTLDVTELATQTLHVAEDLEAAMEEIQTRLWDLKSLCLTLTETPTELAPVVPTPNGKPNHKGRPKPQSTVSDPWDEAEREDRAVREAVAAARLRAEHLAAVRRRRARLQRDLDRARALYPFEIIL
jgi:hypothetical protein